MPRWPTRMGRYISLRSLVGGSRLKSVLNLIEVNQRRAVGGDFKIIIYWRQRAQPSRHVIDNSELCTTTYQIRTTGLRKHVIKLTVTAWQHDGIGCNHFRAYVPQSKGQGTDCFAKSRGNFYPKKFWCRMGTGKTNYSGKIDTGT